MFSREPSISLFGKGLMYVSTSTAMLTTACTNIYWGAKLIQALPIQATVTPVYKGFYRNNRIRFFTSAKYNTSNWHLKRRARPKSRVKGYSFSPKLTGPNTPYSTFEVWFSSEISNGGASRECHLSGRNILLISYSQFTWKSYWSRCSLLEISRR